MQRLTLNDIFQKKEECSKNYQLRAEPICKAVRDFYKEKEEETANLLIKEYPQDALKVYSDIQCKGIEYDELNCKVSKIARRQQIETQVAYYIENRQKLKTDFNECYETMEELRAEKKRTELNELEKSYQCSTVLKAARKINISNFKQPIG